MRRATLLILPLLHPLLDLHPRSSTFLFHLPTLFQAASFHRKNGRLSELELPFHDFPVKIDPFPPGSTPIFLQSSRQISLGESCHVFPLPFLFENIGARVMLSTPPATTISISPLRIACAVKWTACCLEPHWRSIVVPGTSTGYPAIRAACLAMTPPCSPLCVTQP